MFAVCSVIVCLWIWLLFYLYREYYEFYVLLERIYSGIYSQDKNDSNKERNESPESEICAEDNECIEMETFELNET